jgi:hypothetical protein
VSTPFGDFTKWCLFGNIYPMEIQEHRRKRLRQWIEQHHAGNVSNFARLVKMQQSQVADTLDGRKSFGEKVARKFETRAKMPLEWLDANAPAPKASAQDLKVAYHGVYLTRAGAELAAEWEKLDVVDRVRHEEAILGDVKRTVLSRRKPRPAKSTGRDADE